ncbi:putative lysine-specific demethylase JMJ16 isoform X2 [Malus sylvestris]|uniref:putative lysine-specific demethylase JMJ16 isoform X2 n=1 Tax=Malus sylvestris TaxID=3752 RepID=UPI0021ABFD0B|nr:putative lysine-specific demethylase JMJ16 isoform X2 [Malus sylvestris]
MAHNSVPPGFVCRTSFVLKRVNTVEETKNAFVDASSEEPVQMDTTSDLTDMDKLKRQRPWILFDRSDLNSEESDCEQFNTEPATKHCLPKGVTHGCPDCSGCLKVTGRWRPEDARTDVLEEAPLFYPTEEEFKDTLKYVANIRARAEQYGICRIIPPPSWKPPCLIEGKKKWKSSTFSTHIQRIDGIRNQYSPSKMVGLNESPKRKRRRILTVGLDCGSTSSPGETEHSYIKGFETEPGQEFTLENFRSYAADFKRQYFRKSEIAGGQEKWVPSLENIDAEYKRIAENPTEEIEVLCGDNLETKALGSGFPTVSSDSNPLEKSDYPEYLASGWNLNNLPRLPSSLLSFESHDTCHILAPRTRVGMCFSSFHWVKQISPSALKSQGVPVFRCIQSPGEFVLVLPRAYHSGFDSGFNFSETACVAPLDWLPHGQDAVELYCEQGRRTSISHDKLLLGAAREAVRAQWDSLFRKNAADNIFWKDVRGKDGILTHAFKSRLKSEGSRRKYLFNSAKSERMKSNFNVTSKRECSICLCDLHFSAVVCSCCEDRYSCLLHAKQLCSCAWSDKIFLYRHEICDLQLLVEALEGKFDAVYKWGKDDLGLTLHIPKNSQNSPGHVEGASDANKQKESISRIREEVKARILRSTTSNKSNSNDYPTGSPDSATATGNGKSSVSSIMDKVKAHALLRSTIFNELKTKENIVGPTIGTNTTGSNATLTPKVAAEGTTNNASLLPKEAIDMMEGTSDVSSASTSETSSSDSDDVIPDLNILLRGRQNVRSPPVKSNVPQKLPKGGRPADNYKASSSSHLASKSETPRQPCPQSPILISDDSDG